MIFDGKRNGGTRRRDKMARLCRYSGVERGPYTFLRNEPTVF
jgi:hypothetical protein